MYRSSSWLVLYLYHERNTIIDSTKVEETKEVVEEPKENISDTRSRKIIKLAIGLLLVISVALLIYAAFEAYALLM